MTGLARLRNVVIPLLSLVLVPFVASPAQTQEARITGQVTNEQGAPIGNALVSLAALNMGTQANERGEYTLIVPSPRVTGGQVVLTARFIGYAQASRTITLTAGTHEINFALAVAPFRLGETVVTGVGAETDATKLTFTVAKLSEEQLTQVPGTSPIAAIAGKVAGARVSMGRGNPGAPPTIRLRGSTGLLVGHSTPLIILDGVVTAASIADIDANDVESIEILKGAAASSYYGSNAANGVISITTRRGRNVQDNSISYTLRTEYGTSGIERYVPIARARMGADGVFLDDPYPTTGENRWRNQVREWTGSGDFYLTNFQVGGRSGATNFNSSFTLDRNEGIIPLKKGQTRQNVRLNVDQGIGAVADVSFGVSYGNNRNDYNPNGSTAWFSLLQAPQDIDLEFPFPDQPRFFPDLRTHTPSARENPLAQLEKAGFDLRRERIIGSFSARYRPVDWLRLEASHGIDRSNLRQQNYTARGALTAGGTPGPGALTRHSQAISSDNSAVSATFLARPFANVRSTTRVSALYEQFRLNYFFGRTAELNVTDLPTLDAGAQSEGQVFIGSTDQLGRTVNFLAAQAFDINDRYLIDVMARRDGSSFFGPDERWAEFYRVSGAWRITQDFPINGVQELKLRAARGTAGLRPEFRGQYETFTVADGRITQDQLGNRNLKVATQTEDEFGLDITFLDRFDLQLVQANRTTVGAFLEVPLSRAQTNGFRTQYVNAADVNARTTEVSFQTNVVTRPDWSYSFGIMGDRTRQKITRMDRSAFRVAANCPITSGGCVADQGQNVFYYREGEALGIIWGSRWVTTDAELQTMGLNPADYMTNPLGYKVLATTRGTIDERPVRYTEIQDGVPVNQFKIGDVNPDFSFGFSNNLRWRNFTVYALLDGQRGGDVYNFTKQWMTQDHRHAHADMSGVRPEDKIANAFFTDGVYNGLVANDYFVEDGSFVKLREVSVGYNFSAAMLDRVGLGRMASGVKVALIGRNLKTWTSYTGFDPEVTSGGDFNFRIDGFRYPNLRTFTGQVEIRF